MPTKRIALMGGTFDPIHVGHLIAGREVCECLDIPQLVLIPSARPPHKDERAISPATHRLAMAALATREDPLFTVSSIEMERAGKSYTVDTVARLKRIHGPGCQIFFVMGLDSLVEITVWKAPYDLVQSCTVVVTSRPGYDSSAVEPELRERVLYLRVTVVDISSTDVRRRVREGKSIRYLVPPAVEDYIRQNRLYI